MDACIGFEGIVVGAPANSWTHQFAGFLWNEQATLNDPASYIPPGKLPALQAAALAACGGLDGASQRILEDPRGCHFDPAVLQCRDSDGPNCLTAPQVEAAKKVYAGSRNPRTGEQIYPGYEPSTEAGPANWAAWITGPAPGKAIQFFFGNPFLPGMAHCSGGPGPDNFGNKDSLVGAQVHGSTTLCQASPARKRG